MRKQKRHIINPEKIGYKKVVLTNGYIVIKNYCRIAKTVYWGDIAVIITSCPDTVITTLYHKGGAKIIIRR